MAMITVDNFGSPLPPRLVNVEGVDQLFPPGEFSSISGLNMSVSYYNWEWHSTHVHSHFSSLYYSCQLILWCRILFLSEKKINAS